MSYVQELRALIGHRLLILAGATVIVRDAAGRVLMQRRSDNGQWGLPGGALEPGESLEETGRREVWEETGVRVGARHSCR
jgi:8-oxo-dGTP pyrophosphatase MutT (NUDIX family)